MTSRRKAEALIAEGAVIVNGKVVTELGTRVNPHEDHIRVQGRALRTEPLLDPLVDVPMCK